MPHQSAQPDARGVQASEGACPAGREMTPRCAVMRAIYISCHMMMRVIDRAVQPEGMTGSRWHLLIVVRDTQDAPLTITQLSECLFLSPQNVSRMIASLEADGLVARDTSGPGRTVRVRLTEIGHERVEACAALAERCAENMLDGIDLDDIRRTTAVLERLMVNTGDFEKSLDRARSDTDGPPQDTPKTNGHPPAKGTHTPAAGPAARTELPTEEHR